MTHIDIVIDTPWWLMRVLTNRLKSFTKPLFSFLVPFTKKKLMAALVIETITSFRLRLNTTEFGIGTFNLTFWIIRTDYEKISSE